MMKNILKTSLIISILLIICSTNALAYADELFKFDLPDTYKEQESGNEDTIIFVDTKNEARGMVISKQEDKGLKKSVWDIEDRDLDRIVRTISYGSEVVETDKKAKLGKEKAVKIILRNSLFGEEQYLEMYLVASNNYVCAIVFTGETEADLDCEDYKMIKKSFKLKDRSTNPIAIFIIIALVGVGIRFWVANKKQKNNNVM